MKRPTPKPKNGECHKLEVEPRSSGAVVKSVQNMDLVEWREWEDFEFRLNHRRYFYRCKTCKGVLAFDSVRALFDYV